MVVAYLHLFPTSIESTSVADHPRLFQCEETQMYHRTFPMRSYMMFPTKNALLILIVLHYVIKMRSFHIIGRFPQRKPPECPIDSYCSRYFSCFNSLPHLLQERSISRPVLSAQNSGDFTSRGTTEVRVKKFDHVVFIRGWLPSHNSSLQRKL